jgi:hypothetical protein
LRLRFQPVDFGDTGEILVNILPTYRLAVSESMHNRRARVFHPALQLMSCLSFVRGEGHTLWLEGSYLFCEVLSLSATGGPPFATIGKEGGYPTKILRHSARAV